MVQDNDTPRVAIYLDEPLEEGYRFEDAGDNDGQFRWCPSQDQIFNASQYTVNFAADDGDGHVTRKPFALILREALGAPTARAEHLTSSMKFQAIP